MIKQLFQTALTDVADSDLEGVGRIRIEDDGKVYRWVLNASTTVSFVAGDVVAHTVSDGLTTSQQVNKVATANLNLLAGRVMGALAANTGTLPKCYGWIQIRGACTINMEGTTAIAAGDNLKGVNAQLYLVKDTAAGTAPTSRRGATSLAAYSTGAAALVNGFVQCWD